MHFYNSSFYFKVTRLSFWPDIQARINVVNITLKNFFTIYYNMQ
jgi:hypothetical protein